jgi:hypothetical protein
MLAIQSQNMLTDGDAGTSHNGGAADAAAL